MKISTRQYLNDLRKAERKGYAKGFTDACDKHEWNEEKREMYKSLDRLGARVDEIQKELEIARMVREGGKSKKAPEACCANPAPVPDSYF